MSNHQTDWPEEMARDLRVKQDQVLLRKQGQLECLDQNLEATKNDIISRTKIMIRQLYDIYPIAKFPDKQGFSICDIHLPSSTNLQGHDGIMISVAIGYAAHLLALLSDVLDITLRFPIKCFGSKSKIYCSRKNQWFPLYVDSTKAKDWGNFSYGLKLLNLDIVQIRELNGVSTENPEETLENLYGLGKKLLAL